MCKQSGGRVPVTLSPPFSVRVVPFLFRKYSAGIIRRWAALTKLPKKVESKKRYKHFNRCAADAESGYAHRWFCYIILTSVKVAKGQFNQTERKWEDERDAAGRYEKLLTWLFSC